MEWVTPEMVSHKAAYNQTTKQATPVGWLYYWFKVSHEHHVAEEMMRSILGLPDYWTVDPKLGKISSLVLWEIRATFALSSPDLAEVINETTRRLGYDDYFEYYEDESPPRHYEKGYSCPTKITPAPILTSKPSALRQDLDPLGPVQPSSRIHLSPMKVPPLPSKKPSKRLTTKPTGPRRRPRWLRK